MSSNSRKHQQTSDAQVDVPLLSSTPYRIQVTPRKIIIWERISLPSTKHEIPRSHLANAEPREVAASRALSIFSLICLQPWFSIPAIILAFKTKPVRRPYKISIALSFAAIAATSLIFTIRMLGLLLNQIPADEHAKQATQLPNDAMTVIEHQHELESAPRFEESSAIMVDQTLNSDISQLEKERLLQEAIQAQNYDVVANIFETYQFSENFTEEIFQRRDSYYNTLLHRATLVNHLDLVRVLLEKLGEDIENPGGYQRTPLLQACFHGHLTVVEYLIENGANMQAQDALGNLAIHLAALSGNVETVKYLLNLRSDWLDVRSSRFGRTPLLCAAEGGKSAVLKFLVEKGANLDVEDTDAGNKAIHLASLWGNIETVNYLLSLRKNWVEVKSVSLGRTPLLCAAKGGNLEVLRFLLEKGAALDVEDSDSSSKAIHLAALGGDLKTVEYLLTLRSDWIDVRDAKLGRTPLLDAVSGGNLNVVKFLLQKGADIDSEDNDGRKAIHLAAFEGNVNVMKFLVQLDKTLVQAKDRSGQLPIWHARAGNQLAAVEFLETAYSE